MAAFLKLINKSTEEPYTKAAIAHSLFVAMHPYDDGNGRIARAITNYVLSKELGLNDGYYSISTAIEISLQQVQISIQKSNFWESARTHPLNARQIKVLNRLLDAGVDGFKGGLSTKKYISIAKTSTATAKRDIADLVSKNLIEQIEGTAGRNVRYRVKLKDI